MLTAADEITINTVEKSTTIKLKISPLQTQLSLLGNYCLLLQTQSDIMIRCTVHNPYFLSIPPKEQRRRV